MGAPISEADKRLLAKRIGNELAKRYGKKRHYKVKEVKTTARSQDLPPSWDCWALSLYTSPSDFANHHASIGEACDYTAMHSEMIKAVSTDNTLPDVIHHVTPATEVSWFSDLMDFFGSVDFDLPDFDP